MQCRWSLLRALGGVLFVPVVLVYGVWWCVVMLCGKIVFVACFWACWCCLLPASD